MEEVIGLADEIQREDLQELADEADISQWVFDSLMGHLIPEYRLSWVGNIFVPESAGYAQYSRMYDAYDDFLGRSASEAMNEDVETIIDALLDYGRIAAMEMFAYGRKYQRMQDGDVKENRIIAQK